MSAVGAASLALPSGSAWAFDPARLPETFAVPLRVPPVLKPRRIIDGVEHYVTVMRPADVNILSGKQTRAWTFDGHFPGPTIRARRGQPIVVRRVNRLGVPTTTHLHGGRVRPSSDGHATDLVRPGDRKDYRYPNDQEAATLWYHDHTHHRSSRNNYMGLSGLYIIRDEGEDDLNLPRGRYDIPLVLQDRSFRADGSFRFRDDHDAVMGDTYLVNGRPTPYLKVSNRKYRFRVLNASNSRGYNLSLDSMRPLIQIASDGGLLPAPYAATSLPLWPAERAEVVIDFSSYPVGTRVVLRDHPEGADPLTFQSVMRFDVVAEEDDPSSLPATLRSIERLGEGSVEREFILSFDANAGRWEINGKPFDPSRVDVKPKLGDTETWTFRNMSSTTHPMHIHLVQFQVLDRSNLQLSPGDLGWKDTVRVDPSATVRVAMRFDGFTGRYAYHCHNLAHEDHSMMGQMRIVR